MPIKAKCRKCSRDYTVKDELAGKKFRCKQCEAPVTVPQPAVLIEDEPEEDEWGSDDFGSTDDFGDFSEDDYDDIPARPKKRKKKPVVKKRRKKKRSSSSSGSADPLFLVKVVGLIFVIVVGISAVGKHFGARGGGFNLGGFDIGVSWKPYTTPDGNVTVQMPGNVKRMPVAQMAPGGQAFGATRPNFACIIVIEPMPAELQGMTESEIFDAFELGSNFVGASNVQRITFKGRQGVTFDKTAPGGIKSVSTAFVHINKIYTLSYAYKGMKGSKDRKFFDSVVLN